MGAAQHTVDPVADLRRAVYERFDSPATAPDLVLQIQRRADALQAVFAANQDLDGVPATISEELVRHWVAADIAAFRRISVEEQRLKAIAQIGASAKLPLYATVLKSTDRRLAKRTQEPTVVLETPKDVAIKHQPHIRLTKHDDESNQSSPPANGFRGPADTPVVVPKRLTHPSKVSPPSVPSDTFDPQDEIQKLLGTVTYETQSDGTVRYSVRSKPSFVDHGNQILMIGKANEDEESILAGLLMASERYGGAFEITGSEEFKQRAIAIMVKYQVKAALKNPAQAAYLSELSKRAGPQPAVEIPAPDVQSNANATAAPIPATQGPLSVAARSAPTVSETVPEAVPVNAQDWWDRQREIIHDFGGHSKDIEASLRELGPRPKGNETYWFRNGRPCPPPSSSRIRSPTNEPGFAVSSSSGASVTRTEVKEPPTRPISRYEPKLAARPSP